MVYGETERYPFYIDSTIASLKYYLKLGKMPVTIFPKQALIMLQNSLDMENGSKRSNRAGSIKESLESYGFQDVWAQGGVSNEAAFLSANRPKNKNKKKQKNDTTF